LPPGGVSSPGRYAQLNSRWKQFQQQADERIKSSPGERAGLAQLMADIPKMLQGGQLGDAEKRIEQLQAALKVPPESTDPSSQTDSAPGAGPGSGRPAGTPYPGIVKYRNALIEFAQARSNVQGQMRGLRSAILAQWPNEADFANKLATEIERLSQEFGGAVEEAKKAAQNEASPATDAIKVKIRNCLMQVASNSSIKNADSNPLGVAVTIGKTLGDALGRIRDAMPA